MVSKTSAQIDTDLHTIIKKEAERKKICFSDVIREMRAKTIALQGEVQELRTKLNEIQEN